MTSKKFREIVIGALYVDNRGSSAYMGIDFSKVSEMVGHEVNATTHWISGRCLDIKLGNIEIYDEPEEGL